MVLPYEDHETTPTAWYNSGQQRGQQQQPLPISNKNNHHHKLIISTVTIKSNYSRQPLDRPI
jgi:hypothetical protein